MQSWKTLAVRPLVERRPWLALWEEDVQLPNEMIIEGYLRYVARDYAMVFALMADGRAPLVRQYKHGIGEPSYDLPAGYLETPDEPTLAAAQRELSEETGLAADDWRPMGSLLIDTNRGPTRAHLFLARGARRSGQPHLDPTEALEVSYHTMAELRAMVHAGTINCLASVAGIMLGLDLIKEEA